MKPPKYVHPLAEEELLALHRAIRTDPSPRVRIRALMIKLSHEGHTPQKIADLIGGSRQSVLNWIARYEEQGVSGLHDKPRSGARRRVTDAYLLRLKELVDTDPRTLGYRFSNWSVERLEKCLCRETGIEINPAYLNQLLKKHDLVYRNPKHSLLLRQDQEEVNAKKALLEFLKKTQ